MRSEGSNSRCIRALAVIVLVAFPSVVLAGAWDLYVSTTGVDEGNEDGTAEAPFRTIGRAMLEASPGSDSSIHLEQGRYFAADIELPATVLRLRVVGPENGTATIVTPREMAAFVMSDQGGGEGSNPRYEFSRLSLEGGDRGISIVGPQGSRVEVAVTGCEFFGNKLQAVELVAGELGSLDATILDSTFDGAFTYAIDLGTRMDSRLDVEISRNRLVGSRRPDDPDGYLPRYGVAVYLEEGSEIRGRVNANTFTDVRTGILVATTVHSAPVGSLTLDVVNNFLSGSPSPSATEFEHAVFLALHANHVIALRIFHNTLVGGSGHGILLSTHGDGELLCPGTAIDIAGNVFFDFARSAVGIQSALFDPEEDSAGLTDCRRIRGNALEGDDVEDRELASSDDNFSVTGADFVDSSSLDYRPARRSRLIDHTPIVALRTVLGAHDVGGNCRNTDGNGDRMFEADVGAFEFSADVLCLNALLPFARGDCNPNGELDISDAVAVFGYLFLGTVEPLCDDACDGDDNGVVEVTDGIYLLGYLFLDGPSPPAPFPETGLDPTSDLILCLRP